MIDILIENAAVITVDPQRRVYRRGSIAIEGGKILEVGQAEALREHYPAKVTLDASGMIAMPGLINAHMHLPQMLMRGVNDDVDVMGVLKDVIWTIQGCYDEEDARISSRLAFLEMIKSGTTAFLGTGLHPRYGMDTILSELGASGMRGVVSKYVMDASGYADEGTALHPGVWEDGETSLAQAADLIRRWHGAENGRVQVWYSPRSVGGVSKEMFIRVCRLAREAGVGLTTHWSEAQNNVDYCLEQYGKRPVPFAQEVGLLGPDVTFAHGIYLDDDEIALLADTGTNICHCPVCNAKLALQTARVPEMLRQGVNVCLGNDGMPVNNTADLFREMRSALIVNRAVWGDPTFPTAAEALEMATLNGAKAINQADWVGSLEAGKAADLILIDARKPHLTPLHDPVSTVVWAANGSDVDTMIVDGKILMQGRQVLTLPEEAVIAEAEARREKVIAQSGARIRRVWPVI